MGVRLSSTDIDEAGDFVVPNVPSPTDLVSRPDNMDETVLHTECDSLYYNIIVFLQVLSCRNKPFSNSSLTDSSASLGSLHSRKMTDPQPGLNSENI